MEHLIKMLLSASEKDGRSDKALSLAVSSSPRLIKRLREGNLPSGAYLVRLCQTLGIGFQFCDEQIEPYPEIKLIGNIAAGGGDGFGGGQVIAYASDSGERVSAPLGLSQEDLDQHGGISAFRVTGSSMQPVYDDGDLVYVYGRDPMRLKPESLIGKDCAVVIEGGADDGAIYLKRLRRADSGKRGLFNLESLNASFPTMIDVSLHNIMPVRHVKKAIS